MPCNADDVQNFCRGLDLDLVFLVDGSDSITVDDFEKIKAWIAKMVTTLEPSQLETETLAIVTQYSDEVKTEVNRRFSSDTGPFTAALTAVQQMAMGTNTASALAYVSRNVLPR